MLIQFILLLIIIVIVFWLVVKFRSGHINGWQFTVWLGIWLVASAAIINPSWTNSLANVVGVGRGADLVFYVAIVTLFYGIFKLLLRIENLEKQLTQFVREQTINEHKEE